MLHFLNRKITMFAAAIILLVVPLAIPMAANAQTINECLSQGSGLSVTPGTDCKPTNTANGTTQINNLITDAVNIFSGIVGVISVVMIIYGGFLYITSGGDTTKIGNAKTTLIYAIVGLIVVAFSQFIVQFVLNKVVGTA